MKRLLSAAIAAIALAGGAQAQQSATSIVPHFSEEALVSVLQEGGANYRVVQRLDDGSVRINAALGDFQFTIRTTACRQGECVG
ncbi:MAG: hypothetical protein AAFR11_15780, partial [Pseudomonadota bacterium]